MKCSPADQDHFNLKLLEFTLRNLSNDSPMCQLHGFLLISRAALAANSGCRLQAPWLSPGDEGFTYKRPPHALWAKTCGYAKTIPNRKNIWSSIQTPDANNNNNNNTNTNTNTITNNNAAEPVGIPCHMQLETTILQTPWHLMETVWTGISKMLGSTFPTKPRFLFFPYQSH